MRRSQRPFPFAIACCAVSSWPPRAAGARAAARQHATPGSRPPRSGAVDVVQRAGHATNERRVRRARRGGDHRRRRRAQRPRDDRRATSRARSSRSTPTCGSRRARAIDRKLVVVGGSVTGADGARIDGETLKQMELLPLPPRRRAAGRRARAGVRRYLVEAASRAERPPPRRGVHGFLLRRVACVRSGGGMVVRRRPALPAIPRTGGRSTSRRSASRARRARCTWGERTLGYDAKAEVQFGKPIGVAHRRARVRRGRADRIVADGERRGGARVGRAAPRLPRLLRSARRRGVRAAASAARTPTSPSRSATSSGTTCASAIPGRCSATARRGGRIRSWTRATCTCSRSGCASTRASTTDRAWHGLVPDARRSSRARGGWRALGSPLNVEPGDGRAASDARGARGLHARIPRRAAIQPPLARRVAQPAPRRRRLAGGRRASDGAKVLARRSRARCPDTTSGRRRLHPDVLQCSNGFVQPGSPGAVRSHRARCRSSCVRASSRDRCATTHRTTGGARAERADGVGAVRGHADAAGSWVRRTAACRTLRTSCRRCRRTRRTSGSASTSAGSACTPPRR